MSLEWDKLYKLGTDVAGFVFFHPARLAHRKSDPIGWWWEKFGEEFRAGRLIAFCTGSDVTFTMKFVRRPLTPAEEKVLIRAELGPAERPLWAGQPRQGFVLRAADAFLIPFSLLWGGFAIFWETAVLVGEAPWFASLWGIPFVLFGLYFMFGRFWVDARQRAGTFYAVTSERVLIISGGFARRVKSLNIDTLADVSLTERGDGSGVITFGPVPPFYWWYGGVGWPGFGHQAVPSFELAGEARRVYEVIREAQRASRRRT